MGRDSKTRFCEEGGWTLRRKTKNKTWQGAYMREVKMQTVTGNGYISCDKRNGEMSAMWPKSFPRRLLNVSKTGRIL